MKKVIILGVGNFGISWANGVLPACSDVAELAAVVDRDPERLQKIPDTVPNTANIIAEMTNGVTFNYFGTLAASVTQTEWNGDWQIECEKGNLLIRNDKLYITRGEGDRRTEEFIMQENSDSRAEMLREALAAIGEGRKGETDFSDNMKTFLWLHKCIESSDRNEMVAI